MLLQTIIRKSVSRAGHYIQQLGKYKAFIPLTLKNLMPVVSYAQEDLPLEHTA